MCVCLKHRTVLSYISFFFQYIPQFSKTMLIAIMTLIWISRQKHFSFSPRKYEHSEGKFLSPPPNLQTYLNSNSAFSPVIGNKLSKLFSNTSSPLVQWLSLVHSRSLFPRLYLLLYHPFSLCTRSFSWAENTCYGLNCVPQKKICWSSNSQNVTLFRNKVIADRSS